MNTPDIEGKSRAEIAKKLPEAIKTAMKNYHDFSAAIPDKTPEKTPDHAAFKKHQDACKAAVAHIQLLAKLTDWVEEGGSIDGTSEEDIATLIEVASSEIMDYGRKDDE